MIQFKHFLCLFSVLILLQYSCRKDGPDPTPQETTVNAPSAIQITTAGGKATIVGKADVGSEVTFRYDGTNGQVLRQIKADASGGFSLTLDQFVGYEQQLIAFAKKGNQVSDEVKLERIPAKPPFIEDWNKAKVLILAHRWKSDQNSSRMLIKQTQATPPYDMFVTAAQKYFDFKSDGGFHFEVTSPLQFTHTTGSWTMDDEGIITINTVIPLGPMQLKNIRVNELTDNKFSFLTDISDGIFFITLVKE
ncbi:MAG: hypothetical protein ACTHYC_01980 [Sphingobacterium sp.]